MDILSLVIKFSLLIFVCMCTFVGVLIASVSVMLHLLTTDVAEDLISLVAMEDPEEPSDLGVCFKKCT